MNHRYPISTARRFGSAVLVVLMQVASASAEEPLILIRDEFDDGDLALNRNGIGLIEGWKLRGSGIQTAEEADGGYSVSVGKEHSSHSLIAQGVDRSFSFWTAEGVTVTWVIDNISVVTPHKFRQPFAFHWDLGILSADETESRWPYRASGSSKGGFFVFVGKKDHSAACQIRLEVYNKNVAKVEPHPGDPGMARVVDYSADLEFPLTISATLRKKGWVLQVANVRHTGDWTTDLSDGDRRDAEITTEFLNGGYLFLHGRNSGITGEKTTFPANSGRLQSVTVTKGKTP
jgi:hypothetical protein